MVGLKLIDIDKRGTITSREISQFIMIWKLGAGRVKLMMLKIHTYFVVPYLQETLASSANQL